MARIVFQPKGIFLEVAPGESLYAASERSGIRLPLSCRNGVCHICKAQLLTGRVKTGLQGPSVSGKTNGQQSVMLCRVWPETDCEFEIKQVYARGELPLKEAICQVQHVRQLDAHIYQVELSFSAGKIPEFFPGQYLSMYLPHKDDSSFFSIASAPGQRTLELHIQADPHLEKAAEIVEFLKSTGSVKVMIPFGRACLPEAPQDELILMAAGTGFAQMKSIIETLLPGGFKKPMSLYWGVRREQDMYLRALAESWAKNYSNFSFIPLVSDAEGFDCTEHHNQMAEAVLANTHDLNKALVYVSGSPRLVFSALDMLEAAGMDESRFFSDVLEYQKRPEAD